MFTLAHCLAPVLTWSAMVSEQVLKGAFVWYLEDCVNCVHGNSEFQASWATASADPVVLRVM